MEDPIAQLLGSDSEDDITVVDDSGNSLHLKGNSFVQSAAPAPSDGPVVIPPSPTAGEPASVPPPAAPTEPPTAANEPEKEQLEDEQEIAAIREKSAVPLAEPGATPSADDFLEKNVTQAIEASGVKPRSEEAKLRFRKAVELLFRDLRDPLETRAQLIQPKEEGGLGMKEEAADKVMAGLESKLMIFRAVMTEKVVKEKAKFVSQQQDKVMTAQDKQEEQDQDGRNQVFSRVTGKEAAGMPEKGPAEAQAKPDREDPLPTPQPVKPAEPKVIPVIGVSAKKPEAKPAAPKTVEPTPSKKAEAPFNLPSLDDIESEHGPELLQDAKHCEVDHGDKPPAKPAKEPTVPPPAKTVKSPGDEALDILGESQATPAKPKAEPVKAAPIEKKPAVEPTKPGAPVAPPAKADAPVQPKPPASPAAQPKAAPAAPQAPPKPPAIKPEAVPPKAPATPAAAQPAKPAEKPPAAAPAKPPAPPAAPPAKPSPAPVAPAAPVKPTIVPPSRPPAAAPATPVKPPASPAAPAAPTDDKKVVSDVKFTPKLTGPVEELRTLSLDDFRRLSKDPKEATLKIKDKIDLLTDQSFELKTEGVKAWHDSQSNKLYLTLLRSSLEGKPVVEAIKERQGKGEPTLTKPEFDAVMELNRQLRFG